VVEQLDLVRNQPDAGSGRRKGFFKDKVGRDTECLSFSGEYYSDAGIM